MPKPIGRKRVLILLSWYPREESPINGIFIQDQAECLARHHDVTVLVPHFIDWRGWHRRTGSALLLKEKNGVHEWHIRQCTLPPLANLPPLRRWLKPPHPMVAYTRQYVAAVSRGFRQFVTEKGLPDVIHAHVV